MYKSFKGRILSFKKRVYVYRNLNMRGTWYSIMQDGKVVGHTQDFHVAAARFVIRESGRRRAVKTGRKNVHAFVVGIPVMRLTDATLALPSTKVTYNVHTGFRVATGLMFPSSFEAQAAVGVVFSAAGVRVYAPIPKAKDHQISPQSDILVG